MGTPKQARPTRGATIQARPRADGTTAYRVMFRLDGKQRNVTFDEPEAAEQWRARFARDPALALAQLTAIAAADEPADGGALLTVDAMVERHIAGLSGLPGRTLADYRRDHRLHIAPTLGPLPAAALADRTVTAGWVAALGETIAPKTITNVHALLSAACTTAVEAGTLPSNPVRGIRLPRAVPEEMVFLSQAQAGQMLGETPPHWRPLVVTLLGSGVRWGEATALRVGDVDLDGGTLRVAKAIGRDEASRSYVKTTKTRRGVRTVRIPPGVVDVLRPLVLGRPSVALLFTTRVRATIVRHNNFHGRVWTPLVARLRDDPYGWDVTPRIHDLRHTYASWALAAGVPLIELQRQMGHESIVTTADRYGHLEPSAGRATAAAIGSRLDGALAGARSVDGGPAGDQMADRGLVG